MNSSNLLCKMLGGFIRIIYVKEKKGCIINFVVRADLGEPIQLSKETVSQPNQTVNESNFKPLDSSRIQKKFKRPNQIIMNIRPDSFLEGLELESSIEIRDSLESSIDFRDNFEQ